MEDDSRNAAISKKRAISPEGACDSPPPKRARSNSASSSASESPSQSQPQLQPQSASFLGWNRGVKASIRPTLGRARSSTSKPNVSSVADKIESETGVSVKQATSPSSQLGSTTVVSDATKARAAVQPPVKPEPREPEPEEEGSSSEEGEIQSAFSGDDEAVVINVAGSEPAGKEDEGEERESDLESGEISDDQEPVGTGFDGAEDERERDGDASDHERNFQRRLRDMGSGASNPAPEIIDLEDDDGSMMRQPPNGNNTASTNAAQPTAPQSSSSPVTLADLSIEDLQLQLRYYHHGVDPTLIPLSTLATCTSCALPGHISSSCPALTCRHCGSYNDHLAAECPEFSECTKCGRKGHEEGTCKSQLRAMQDDLSCIICGCSQHLSMDCESHWRTSAFPPTLDLRKQLRVRLYCYECGDAGHLGNDCSRRRPGKGPGSSMWSSGTLQGGKIPGQVRLRSRARKPNLREVKAAERQRLEKDADHGNLVQRKSAPKPKQKAKGPAMKIGGNIGKNRPDLKGPSGNNPKPGPAQNAPGPKKKKNKSKNKPPGSSYRPMPSAAKKAFTKGKS